MMYLMIAVGVAQAAALLLVLAILRAGSRADRELENTRRGLPAA